MRTARAKDLCSEKDGMAGAESGAETRPAGPRSPKVPLATGRVLFFILTILRKRG